MEHSGAQSVSVNYANASGCSSAVTAVRNVTVNALPVPTISGATTVCAGSQGNVYSTESGMSGYTWIVSSGGTITSDGGATDRSATVTWNTAGAQSVSVNYTTPGGCTATAAAQKSVTVSPLPGSAGTITGSSTICAGTQNVSYSIAAIVNATSYTWSVPQGATIESGSGTNTITVNYGSGATSGSVSVYGSNGCGKSNTSSLNVSVSALAAAAGNISGPSAVCQGSTGLVFTVAPIANATSYTWSVPQGATIISGAGTGSIMVDLAMSSTTGQITVYGSNSCGQGAASAAFTLTVNAIPSNPVVTSLGSGITSNTQVGNQWYYSETAGGAGSAITGATGQVYTPTQNGYYWSVVTTNGCSSSASNRIYRLRAGESNRYNIYPVPNHGEFTVSITTPDEQDMTIEIYDQLGRKVYQMTGLPVNGELKRDINLRPAPSGVYTIVFRNKQGAEVRKFNINK